jgi:hypothetical protein
MGNGLLYDLTSDIDDDVKGMSPEVEKQVRLNVLADRIKNHNGRNGNNNQNNHQNNNQNNTHASYINGLINGHKNGRVAKNYSRQKEPEQASRILKPKKFLEIELPLSPEFLENCIIKQKVRFEAKFDNKLCQVTGSIANIQENGISLDKVRVSGPVEPYNMCRQLHLRLPKQPKYAPAPAYA